ncbi:MAG: hypothetical protein A2Z25_14630 [Planctomycetes bacterium RBG_16_55_9]|nr:MAG: hypothetical protein A2Z25_14630 [Planctomycetes bacterium RBG_16_55_9]
MYDYSDLIENVVLPGLEQTKLVKPYEDLQKTFAFERKNDGGDRVQKKIQITNPSNARNFTKADVNPVSPTPTYLKAHWLHKYSENPFEVSEIDLNQARGRGDVAVENLITDAMRDCYEGLINLLFDNVYARIKADLLNSGTYSDAAINRSTYPVFAVHNEITATPLTYGLIRSCRNTTVNGKSVGENVQDEYVWLIENTAFDTLEPQLALLTTWNSTNDGQAKDAGWAPIGKIQGVPTYKTEGMTDGDVLFLRKQDVHIQEHMPRTVTYVDPGRFTIKGVIRIGVTPWVERCWAHGMMTNKT